MFCSRNSIIAFLSVCFTRFNSTFSSVADFNCLSIVRLELHINAVVCFSVWCSSCNDFNWRMTSLFCRWHVSFYSSICRFACIRASMSTAFCWICSKYCLTSNLAASRSALTFPILIRSCSLSFLSAFLGACWLLVCWRMIWKRRNLRFGRVKTHNLVPENTVLFQLTNVTIQKLFAW